EVVVAAVADGGGVGEQRPGESAHRGEVQEIPVEARDVIVAKLHAGNGVRAPEEHAGGVTPKPALAARIEQLDGELDVAEGARRADVEAEHVPGGELEEAERARGDAD